VEIGVDVGQIGVWKTTMTNDTTGTVDGTMYEKLVITYIGDLNATATVVAADVYSGLTISGLVKESPDNQTIGIYDSSYSGANALAGIMGSLYLIPKGIKIGDYVEDLASTTSASVSGVTYEIKSISKGYGMNVSMTTSGSTMSIWVIYSTTGVLLDFGMKNVFIADYTIEMTIDAENSTLNGADEDPDSPGGIAGFPIAFMALAALGTVALVLRRKR
jgi:hypothetical protein